MAANLLYRLDGGFECDLAAIDGGWAMAAVSMEDVDSKFVSNMDSDREWEDIKAMMLPGATYDQWTEAYVSLRPTLHLLEGRANKVETLHTASAEQFSGVAVTGGDDPAYVWADLDEGRWSASLYDKGESRLLHAQDRVLQSPSIARDGSGILWLAWVSREDSEDVIQVTDEAQTISFQVPGRYPSLVATNTGVAMCYERAADGQSHVYFAQISAGSIGTPVQVSSRNPLNFDPRCIPGSDGGVLVVWESSPAWGYDVQVDQVRDIELKRIDPVSGRISDGPGTEESGGLVPILFRAYNRPQSRLHAGQNRLINMTPSNPRLLRLGDELVCAFRMVHPIKTRPYVPLQWILGGAMNRTLPYRDSDLSRDAWGVCITRWDGKSWSKSQRVTESLDFAGRESGNEGFGFHQYGLAAVEGAPVVACHCFNNFNFPPRGHRVEVLPVDGKLSPMHAKVKHHGGQPQRPANPPADAPELPGAPPGLQLVYGDLHVHTSHSSCSPAEDGSPPDNIRLQRDVLGYRVISLSDHHSISDSDFRQRQDLLEREHAGGRVPIYGLEWNKKPWQHINFFTYDKEAMKELRILLHKDLDLQLVFDEIADGLLDKVCAIRHYHGGKDPHTYLYDPRIEWGMEVMCGRGDRMATEEGMFGGPSAFPFPVNFIEWRDAKLAMIGASDHHMSVLGACLTGFWVPEVTGEAVFDAMRQRRTIACANGKTALWIESNGVGMGQAGPGTSPVELTVSITSPLPVDQVSLWSDGKWVEHRKVEDGQTRLTFVDEPSGPGEHYYFVRAQSHRAREFPRGPLIAYSSPVWLNIE